MLFVSFLFVSVCVHAVTDLVFKHVDYGIVRLRVSDEIDIRCDNVNIYRYNEISIEHPNNIFITTTITDHWMILKISNEVGYNYDYECIMYEIYKVIDDDITIYSVVLQDDSIYGVIHYCASIDILEKLMHICDIQINTVTESFIGFIYTSYKD